MPATRTRTIRVSYDLYEASELRAKALGYPSVTAYFEGLARYDCATQSRHGVTIQWAKLKALLQDMLDAVLLRRVKSGAGMTAAEVAKWDWQGEAAKAAPTATPTDER